MKLSLLFSFALLARVYDPCLALQKQKFGLLDKAPIANRRQLGGCWLYSMANKDICHPNCSMDWLAN
ncbi:hypothetical protein SAMN05216283_102588 [Sunxiuqinia elliptica]|uniref:Uncharacterized protein n=1 Tax=Sunxiuqinia elliptica TaxID=655355 RepID=A0A1I2FSL5_9BACT|nr:hypothetical protein SAMN05216283_102588 [Sunxiuqinia elliptica]